MAAQAPKQRETASAVPQQMAQSAELPGALQLAARLVARAAESLVVVPAVQGAQEPEPEQQPRLEPGPSPPP